jgi:5-methylthioadenosine/S-adenosylhomocysteine deaminase
MSEILIQNGMVLTLDSTDTVHNPGWVRISGDSIVAVGAGAVEAAQADPAVRILDAAGMAVLPGLVNGHTHLSQTFMRGLMQNRILIDALRQVIWLVQGAMTSADMRLASLLGLVENLRCGVTAVVQHHKVTASPAHIDAAAEAAELVGLRLLLARGWVDTGANREPAEQIIGDVDRLRRHWHGAAGGRISVGFGPMVPWRCSDETMKRTHRLAREWGLRTHIHTAETREEIDMLRERTGLRHVEWLHSLGALDETVQLVHSVWVEESELDLIAASGAVVVHCPVSNMYVAAGISPLRKMLKRGIRVTLGTDGPSVNDTQDLLETMKVAALLAKVSTGDPRAVSAQDILHMATCGGPVLLGQADTGRLVPGAKADITILNLRTARAMPLHDPASAVVYNSCGPDVHTVLVDGRILLDANRVTVLDEQTLLAECQEAADRLMVRAGVVHGTSHS